MPKRSPPITNKLTFLATKQGRSKLFLEGEGVSSDIIFCPSRGRAKFTKSCPADIIINNPEIFKERGDHLKFRIRKQLGPTRSAIIPMGRVETAFLVRAP